MSLTAVETGRSHTEGKAAGDQVSAVTGVRGRATKHVVPRLPSRAAPVGVVEMKSTHPFL